MARITRRASSSCGRASAYATVSLACVWSAGGRRVGPGAAGRRRRADLRRRHRRRRRKHARRRRHRRQSRPPPDAGRAAAGGARSGGRRHEEPVRAQLEHVPALGPREQRLRRPGALAALPGPSRRPAVHARDACCARPPTGTAASAPTTSAGAISAMPAATNGSASSRSTACGTRSRSSTASIRARRSPRPTMACSCWTTTRNGRRSHNAYLPISPQFDLRERRDIGTFRVSATPTTQLDVTGGFTTTKHSGELPWGASFGFSNDNEVALPYRSRTNDMDMGLEWTNNKAMFRAGYNGSWFNNQADTLTWDNPLVLTDHDVGRLRARPDGPVAVQLVADAQRGWLREVRAADAAHRLARLRLGEQRRAAAAVHDQQRAAAVRAAAGDHRRLGARRSPRTISLVSRPANVWRFSTRFRRYDYNNDMPETADSAVHQLRHLGRRPARRAVRSCSRTPATRSMPMPRGPASVRWPSPSRYTNNHNGYDHRIFESTNENVLQLKADSTGFGWMNFRARYEYGNRSGSGLDEASLVQIGEQPALRHYDVADRTRNRFVGQVDVVADRSADVQRQWRGRLGRVRRQLLRVAGGRFPQRDAQRRLHDRRRASAWAPATTTNGTRVCSDRARRVRARPAAGDRSQPRLDRGFEGTRPLLFDLREPAADRRQHRGAFRVRIRARRAGTSSTRSDPRCRRRRSCRRRSTSSRTSGSTCAIG